VGTVMQAQPASTTALHCYARGGVHFDTRRLPRVLGLPGVRSAYLTTAGRPPERWCLYLEPDRPVARANAAQLAELVGRVGRAFGLDAVQLIRPVERQDGGPASDQSDWLKW
jgi:hypothetical protein